MRPALTQADWRAFGRAAEKWADDARSATFRAVVEEIVRDRVAKAWEQGYDRGWSDGVSDATRDDGEVTPRSRNPYLP